MKPLYDLIDTDTGATIWSGTREEFEKVNGCPTMPPKETIYTDRIARCAQCKREGVHVDTESGEIVEHGIVTRVVPDTVLHLMADPQHLGDLTCDRCYRRRERTRA